MPALTGFSDNPFVDHSDLISGAIALLKPLEQYKSPAKARIKVATASGAGFGETSAQLEGFARPLWVVADLLRIRFEKGKAQSHDADLDLDSWVAGLKAGTDPGSTEYWGDLIDFDQRMVEMESIALSLLSAPSVFGFPHDDTAKGNLIHWLIQINSHKMPVNNWRWFRIFVNLALIKTLGVPREKVKAQMDRDFAVLDSFYLGEGWSSDGLWGDERKQADYYSGSFAIQFAQLLFIRYASDYEPERTDRYKKQAQEFSAKYWRYFDHQGAAIPFGRSLTYRFAFAAFWSAAALADVEMLAPLHQSGIVKGLLLRHLRWWAKQPDIFNTDGTLSIGYTYPNMYLSEDYNSPQSVYWCLKSLIVLGIRPDHPFWTCEEAAHPMQTQQLASVELIWPAKHIMCNTSEHHFLLSSGQSSRKDHKAREAKYSKFAYSSAFSFSVPVGPLLEQTAPDSVLCVSQDDGETWKVHWDPYDVRYEVLQCKNEEVPVLVSSWRPWKRVGIVLETQLIPPMKNWPGWHLRVHTIKLCSADIESLEAKSLRLFDCGFAISAQTSEGDSIFEKPLTGFNFEHTGTEGYWQVENSALVISEAGACGVMDLTKRFLHAPNEEHCMYLKSQSKIIRPNANTNLTAQRTLIPSTHHAIRIRKTDVRCEGGSLTIVTGIFALEGNKVKTPDVWNLWQNPPSGRYSIGSNTISLGE